MRVCIFYSTLLVSGAISSQAMADSFCGFDAGLVGTKAVGYTHPYALKSREDRQDSCELKVYDKPSTTATAITRPCTDFKHVPSQYVAENELADLNPLETDYFQLQIFDSEDQWVQLALKTGVKKWAQKDYSDPSDNSYQYKSDDIPATIMANYPTQATIYDEPRLDKPAAIMGQYLRQITDDWIDDNIPLDFFAQDVFKMLEKYGAFDPDKIEQAQLATHYGEFLFVGYEVKALMKDKDGREWLKAEEYLDISYWAFWEYFEEIIEVQGKTLYPEDRELIDTALLGDEFRSKAGRIVYFPYREPSGTITMVMTDGPNCGC